MCRSEGGDQERIGDSTDSLSPSLIVIEEDYDGPQLEDGKVTAKFMDDLIQHYRDQKKLHRRYAYKVSRWTFHSLLFLQLPLIC